MILWRAAAGVAFVGLSFAIVLPYVVVDYLDGSARHLSASDWAAWAQAILSATSVAAAAFIAIYQQESQRRRQEELRRRKNSAARAMLPAAFSGLCDYTSHCFGYLRWCKDYNAAKSSANIAPPKIPADLILIMKDCIEFADEVPRDHLCELIEKIQIQNDRLTLVRPLTTPHTINTSIVDTVEIYARIDLLFPYARRQNDGDAGSPTLAKMQTAANLNQVIHYPDVSSLIERRYGPPTTNCR